MKISTFWRDSKILTNDMVVDFMRDVFPDLKCINNYHTKLKNKKTYICDVCIIYDGILIAYCTILRDVDNLYQFYNFGVRPAYRNKQIGTMLFKHVIKKYTYISWIVAHDNATAIKFYEKMNYAPSSLNSNYYLYEKN